MNVSIHNTSSSKTRQQGLSLIELMVALTIGLILMLGVGQIFLSNKASYNIQNGLGQLQENARFALNIMSQDIGMAGYDPVEDGTTVDAFNAANTLENQSANADLGFTVAAGTASDTVEINYTSATDCNGNASGGTATNRYYLNNTDLMCLGNGSATAEVIAEGIENMQILYGEDTDNTGIANHYVSASNVTDWTTIKTVRIALLASTIEAVGALDDNTYSLLNTPPLGPMDDNQLRRIFSQTTLIRN